MELCFEYIEFEVLVECVIMVFIFELENLVRSIKPVI
jgi:hypothetical protein